MGEFLWASEKYEKRRSKECATILSSFGSVLCWKCTDESFGQIEYLAHNKKLKVKSGHNEYVQQRVIKISSLFFPNYCFNNRQFELT